MIDWKQANITDVGVVIRLTTVSGFYAVLYGSPILWLLVLASLAIIFLLLRRNRKRLYPQCLSCIRQQGDEINKAAQAIKKSLEIEENK